MGYICCLIICFQTFLIRPHNVLFPFLFVEGKCRLKGVESEIWLALITMFCILLLNELALKILVLSIIQLLYLLTFKNYSWSFCWFHFMLAQQGKIKNYQQVNGVTLLIWEAARIKIGMIWDHDKCARWQLKLSDSWRFYEPFRSVYGAISLCTAFLFISLNFTSLFQI